MRQVIYRINELKRITGVSRSFIYASIQAGNFPSSIKLGPRAVGWLSSDIETWIAERIRTKSVMGDQK
jgi:prophage regulatory protein